MTTIAAIQGNDFAVVAFDSLVSEGEEKTFILPRSLPKVVKTEDYIVGAAGDLRAVNLVTTFPLSSPPSEASGRELDLWVGRTFIPDLKELFEDAGYDKESEHESTIILVVNFTIYEIGTSYEWLRDDRGIYSTGTGSHYALGYLRGCGEEIKKDLHSAEFAARRAVELAAQMDPTTGGPIYVEHVRREAPEISSF